METTIQETAEQTPIPVPEPTPTHYQVPVPVLYRQIGWMKCVACSDTFHSQAQQGRMWLGKEKNGVDIVIACPCCQGTRQVPKYQILNAVTGEEIDYEAYGRDENGVPNLITEAQQGVSHGQRV